MVYTIFWFRRDLRLKDNAGLFHALRNNQAVIPLFIFDRNILDDLDKSDARLTFIYHALDEIQNQLIEVGSSLHIFYGDPVQIWQKLIGTYTLSAVYTNHDYEPYARERDKAIEDMLNQHGVSFHTFKDQVIFEKKEILSNQGSPYTVFTPYSKKWKAQLNQEKLAAYPTFSYWHHFIKTNPIPIPSLESMGFKKSQLIFPVSTPKESTIRVYHKQRNFPAKNGTTRLSVHLRFGTISIRALARKAVELNETYLNELIWREFYMQILWNFPYVASGPFKKKYAAIAWRNNEEEFQKWCDGKTGFPIVDAGMRELNTTGFMHNRVRMIVASFLVKDLLIDWQWGEAYFAEKLLDFELASNNGGWQWAAGCGTDAAPYFRIFNPTSQMKKFDPQLEYVRKWVPEYGTPTYPEEIVDHKFARERCLEVFKAAL